ncbi:MAG: response regulator [Cyclobacteriaceae bacterium]|nr:response regulator [Cyclobacteriaceae bacterium]
MNSKTTILIVDDEPQIRRLLEITLQHDFQIVEAMNAREALQRVANHPPDLVLLDLGLPDESGHEVLRKLREWYIKPVIILSVQQDEEDIVRALDNGANDYLIKPFRTGELQARIRSALRSATPEESSARLDFGDVSIDFAARRVTKGGVPIKLTATEYSLLALLMHNEGKVMTHRHLLQEVWGPSYTGESQYLRVFIAQLRKKVEDDPNRPAHILTESGVGYRFVGK